MANRRVYRTCPQCGGEYWGRPTKYCSRACYIATKKTGEERPCAICGTTMYVAEWDRSRITCSYECAGKWHAREHVQENNPLWLGPLTKKCKGCDQTFQYSRSDQKRKYCSHACYAAAHSRIARAKWPTSECAVCGKRFRYKSNSQPGICCSNACRHIWNSGPNAPGYRHGRVNMLFGTAWQRVRDAAVARDGHRCQHCGCTKGEAKGNRLHVHHKIPRALFGDVNAANALHNLITLCPTCHGKEERKTRKMYRSGQLHLLV